jgi:hypothetical protein
MIRVAHERFLAAIVVAVRVGAAAFTVISLVERRAPALCTRAVHALLHRQGRGIRSIDLSGRYVGQVQRAGKHVLLESAYVAIEKPFLLLTGFFFKWGEPVRWTGHFHPILKKNPVKRMKGFSIVTPRRHSLTRHAFQHAVPVRRNGRRDRCFGCPYLAGEEVHGRPLYKVRVHGVRSAK